MEAPGIASAPETALFLGLISGTSMDGIDAALVDFAPANPEILGALSRPYDAQLRQNLVGVCAGQPLSAGALADLDSQIGLAFADASLALLTELQVSPSQVIAIGSHGQNVFHGPWATPASTLQLGNPHLIAERTGITTVADFRRRDVAMGGQGAPLAPALHQRLFRAEQDSTAVLNVGGIANLTLLPAAADLPTTGFDTGPGNCLMDEWIRQHLDQSFDAGGAWAGSGTAIPQLLSQLLVDPYFSKPAPKSTGREYFNLTWLKGYADLSQYRAADVQATLAELTVQTIAQQLAENLPDCSRLLICGGGAHNQHLLNRLDAQLQSVAVQLTDQHGICADWVEATLFASLARSALSSEIIDLQAVTGAAPHVYGVVFPASGA